MQAASGIHHQFPLNSADAFSVDKGASTHGKAWKRGDDGSLFPISTAIESRRWPWWPSSYTPDAGVKQA
jgi:hypothetical protein